ncbi:BREX-2 system phosphatase PglZ [Glycomyces scopariae]
MAARDFLDRTSPSKPVLLRAAPVWRHHKTITLGTNGNQLRVTVRPAATVLAILDLVSGFDGDGLLVIPTPVTELELGDSLRAQIAYNQVRSINPWDAIRGVSGADRVDPMLQGKGNEWIADELLTYGSELWKRRTQPPPVLGRDDVLRRLLGVRLHGDPDAVVDVASMLSWSQATTSVEQWRALAPGLRAKLSSALREVAGSPAAIVTALADSGEAHDSIAIAVVARALDTAGPVGEVPRAVFEYRLFRSSSPEPRVLHRFAEAGLAHLMRSAATDPAVPGSVYRRAESILRELKADAVIADSDLFPAGFDARLDAFAAALQGALRKPEALGKAEDAFQRLTQHRLASERTDPIESAHSALRLARWLAGAEPGQRSVAEWVDWQVREGGWVDAMRARLRVADTAERPRLARVYQSVLKQAEERRRTADEQFAERLSAWTAGPTDRLILAENLQERIMRPLADAKGSEAAPLLIVCDGMSAADATAVGADMAADRSWVEVGRSREGREGALAAVPSSTVYSRASLLAGRLTTGGSDVERKGFAVLWGRRKTQLFHKGDLRAVQAGQIPEALREALADRGTVVAVVLNTIDDALDKDELVSRPVWRLQAIDYLRPLLEAASRASRPVVLCSDHGHVRHPANAKAAVAGESARWRLGDGASEGEIKLSGPRVLEGDNLIAAVDERIRYRSRKAGYHGGASLAEMVIPVQVYVPTAKARAEHWVVYESAAAHQPEWWSNPVRTSEAPVKSKRRKGTAPAAAPLFDEGTLGRRVCESTTFTAQIQGIRRAPDPAGVAVVLDAIAETGGVLAAAQVGRVAGKAAASVDGYISQLQRALNIDGTQVLIKQDNGSSVKLDLELLRQQFLGGGR